jgi:hypothetical protein
MSISSPRSGRGRFWGTSLPPVPVVRLTEIFRQAAESRIITNAHRINQGLMPDLAPVEGSSMRWTPRRGAQAGGDRAGADPRVWPAECVSSSGAITHRCVSIGDPPRLGQPDREIQGSQQTLRRSRRIRTVGPACQPAPELSGGTSPIWMHGHGVARQAARGSRPPHDRRPDRP